MSERCERMDEQVAQYLHLGFLVDLTHSAWGTTDAPSQSSLIVSLFLIKFDDFFTFKNSHICHPKITRDGPTRSGSEQQ